MQTGRENLCWVEKAEGWNNFTENVLLWPTLHGAWHCTTHKTTERMTIDSWEDWFFVCVCVSQNYTDSGFLTWSTCAFQPLNDKRQLLQSVLRTAEQRTACRNILSRWSIWSSLNKLKHIHRHKCTHTKKTPLLSRSSGPEPRWYVCCWWVTF